MDLIRFPLALQTKSIRFSEVLANENTQLTLQPLGGSPSYLGVVCDHPSGLSVLTCLLLPYLVGLFVSTLFRETFTQDCRKI